MPYSPDYSDYVKFKRQQTALAVNRQIDQSKKKLALPFSSYDPAYSILSYPPNIFTPSRLLPQSQPTPSISYTTVVVNCLNNDYSSLVRTDSYPVTLSSPTKYIKLEFTNIVGITSISTVYIVTSKSVTGSTVNIVNNYGSYDYSVNSRGITISGISFLQDISAIELILSAEITNFTLRLTNVRPVNLSLDAQNKDFSTAQQIDIVNPFLIAPGSTLNLDITSAINIQYLSQIIINSSGYDFTNTTASYQATVLQVDTPSTGTMIINTFNSITDPQDTRVIVTLPTLLSSITSITLRSYDGVLIDFTNATSGSKDNYTYKYVDYTINSQTNSIVFQFINLEDNNWHIEINSDNDMFSNSTLVDENGVTANRPPNNSPDTFFYAHGVYDDTITISTGKRVTLSGDVYSGTIRILAWH